MITAGRREENKMTLNEVLMNTNYDVSLFSEEARKIIEKAIVVKSVRGKEMPFIICLKRGKEIVLKPEEAVRQLYLYKNNKHYQKQRRGFLPAAVSLLCVNQIMIDDFRC